MNLTKNTCFSRCQNSINSMVVGAGLKPARNRNHIQIENQIEKRNVKNGTLSILHLKSIVFLLSQTSSCKPRLFYPNSMDKHVMMMANGIIEYHHAT